MNFLFIVGLDKVDRYHQFCLNLFINDILNNCDEYSVSIGNKKWCGDLFADDIVLIAPSERKMKTLLRHVFFDGLISKCVIMVIQPLNFVLYPCYEDPTFLPLYVFYP